MRFERASRGRRGPGLTPLIDVVFLLLVFFMLASRFDRESALALSVTAPSAGDVAEPVFRVELGPSGDTSIDGRPASPESVRAAAARARRNGRPVRVRPDPETELQSIVDVLGLLERAGVTDASLERE